MSLFMEKHSLLLDVYTFEEDRSGIRGVTMADHVYFKDPDVEITSEGVVVAGEFYPIQDLQSAYVTKHSSPFWSAAFWAVVAGLATVCWMAINVFDFRSSSWQ